jgi:hypothetical protein
VAENRVDLAMAVDGAVSMEQSDARQILQSLLQGLDPLTGGRLEPASVCRHREVVEALLAAISALDAEMARERRRAHLPQNLGRPWSEAEEERLGSAFRAGQGLPSIAAEHRRTLAAIEARLERMGLLAPEQRVTRNRYVSREIARNGTRI